MNTYESMPRSYSFTPANINANGFATAVTGAAWTLTATTSGDSLAHKVTITNNSGNSKAGINIVLVGFDENGNAQTETLTGPGASVAVTSVKYYSSLTSVTPASTWGADTAGIGWAGAFASAWINVNYLAEDILSLVADVTGTMSFTLNQTFDRFDQPGVTARWFAIAAAETVDGIWQSTGGATGVQFIANSYSNGATMALNANATFVPNAVLPGSEVDVASIGGAPIALGQAVSASSLPVVPASDYFPAGYTYSRKTADGQVKASGGVVHSITISPTGTVTAGVLTIYDNAAETGTVLFSVSLPITTFATIVLPLDAVFTNGLFVGFDATLANVQVLVSYR